MTRSITPAARRAMAAAGQRAKRSGLLGMPGTMRARQHPDWILHRVAQVQGERRLDQREAAETFKGRPWASTARYLGYGRGLFVWEREP